MSAPPSPSPPPAPPTSSPRRRLLVAGNWKMNGTRALARTLAQGALTAARGAPDVDVAVFPPYPLLPLVGEIVGAPAGPVALGGQACHADARGAHTSAVSAAMLAETGCTTVLCGHSEVRKEQGQTDDGVVASARAALSAGLRPILCVGESGDDRDGGRTREVLARQVGAIVQGLGGVKGLAGSLDRIDLAYEPVWAIGTGRNATPEQAAEVHGWIRSALDGAGGERARILYGGSVAPANIAGFLSQPGVDGVLVGGQSLEALAFAVLVEAARNAALRRRA